MCAGAVRTIAAYGEGLTCIKMPKVDESVGNIYSDALPPWLQPSTGVSETGHSAIIGPTIDDLEKHAARQRKLKLPATRVGANFDHQVALPGSSWMPSFGRVWSKNSRKHQQNRFVKKELNKFKWQPTGQYGGDTGQVSTGHAQTHSQSADSNTISDSLSGHHVKYQRKRYVQNSLHDTGFRLNIASNLL
jgi:hypothetical protein